jgi:hypothetical protein
VGRNVVPARQFRWAQPEWPRNRRGPFEYERVAQPIYRPGLVVFWRSDSETCRKKSIVELIALD